MNDILDKEDVKTFIDAFYGKVRIDPLIGAVFAARIKEEEWSVHLERMYSFWNTVLFAQKDYRGNPFSKHRSLPIEAIHFERWLGLFKATIDEHFTGDKAEETKLRAVKMGAVFQAKLAYLRANDSYINLM